MSAYLIFTREQTLDEQQLATYAKQMPATAAGHSIKILAMNGSHEDLEGAPSEGSEIIEFSSVEAAKVWYDSSLYREVREHRFKGAIYRVTLVEGTPHKRHWLEFAGSV
jgi:uncharacterized protein (DUF1330 family)